jgi:hypothetical protein
MVFPGVFFVFSWVFHGFCHVFQPICYEDPDFFILVAALATARGAPHAGVAWAWHRRNTIDTIDL